MSHNSSEQILRPNMSVITIKAGGKTCNKLSILPKAHNSLIDYCVFPTELKYIV